MTSNNAHQPAGKVLLSSRFRSLDRGVFLGRARLYPDRIVLSGLTWKGRYRRTVMLDEVARIKWWTGEQNTVNLALYLRNDEAVKMWVAGSGLWKYQVEACMGRRAELRGELPGQMASASAA